MPGPCSCCQVDPFAVACEALIVRALEVLGKRIGRQPRSRWRDLQGLRWDEAYLRWIAGDRDVDAALDGAWERVGELVVLWRPDADPAEVAALLDCYTRCLIHEQVRPDIVEVRHLLAREEVRA